MGGLLARHTAVLAKVVWEHDEFILCESFNEKFSNRVPGVRAAL